MMVHGLPFAVHCSPLGFRVFNPGTANGELRTVNREPKGAESEFVWLRSIG